MAFHFCPSRLSPTHPAPASVFLQARRRRYLISLGSVCYPQRLMPEPMPIQPLNPITLASSMTQELPQGGPLPGLNPLGLGVKAPGSVGSGGSCLPSCPFASVLGPGPSSWEAWPYLWATALEESSAHGLSPPALQHLLFLAWPSAGASTTRTSQTGGLPTAQL